MHLYFSNALELLHIVMITEIRKFGMTFISIFVSVYHFLSLIIYEHPHLDKLATDFLIQKTDTGKGREKMNAKPTVSTWERSVSVPQRCRMTTICTLEPVFSPGWCGSVDWVPAWELKNNFSFSFFIILTEIIIFSKT